MTGPTSKKFSHQAKGIVLMAAAVPIIVVIKYFFEDHSALGMVASLLLAFGSIELSNREN